MTSANVCGRDVDARLDDPRIPDGFSQEHPPTDLTPIICYNPVVGEWATICLAGKHYPCYHYGTPGIWFPAVYAWKLGTKLSRPLE